MRLSNLLRSLPVGKTLNESKDRLVSARLKQIMNEELKPSGEILERGLTPWTNVQPAAFGLMVRAKYWISSLAISS